MTSILALLLLVGVAPLPLQAQAQPDPIPQHKEPYHLDSRDYEGLGEAESVFRETIRVPDIPWLRIHFDDYNLGTESYVTITSVADGAQQSFNAETLPQWLDSTAFFNGDAVEVELHVAPGETGIFIKIEEITVGEWVGEGAMIESICGATDDRVSSTDPREGRIVGAHGCTGWIASNGAHLAAGHCVGGTGDILEFNVPDSLGDGTIQHPGTEYQYPIVWGDSTNGGTGNDWAVFDCSPNATTGLLPVQAQGAFYRMSRDSNPTTVRVTGYGVDGPPPNWGYGTSPRNSDNRTLQTHYGPYKGEEYQSASDVYIKYAVDTLNAGSGSPVIVYGTTTTIGIHTDGGCHTDGQNYGTSFENNNLENAIQTFPGSNVVYADVGHPVSYEDGTVLRPYDTISEAVSAVTSNGRLSIVKGSYSKAAGNTFTAGADGKSFLIEAPVGTVTIGY